VQVGWQSAVAKWVLPCGVVIARDHNCGQARVGDDLQREGCPHPSHGRAVEQVASDKHSVALARLLEHALERPF
jgi:hypothetical protein